MKLVIGLLALAAIAYSPATHACACCAEHGDRRESIDPLDANAKSELQKLRFVKKTRLNMGAGGTSAIKGIADPQDAYDLTLARSGDRWTFTFKDAKGKTGTLEFALPTHLESFFVDQDRKPNTETVLYKEWRLNAVATSTGIFAGSGSPIVRVVLQGRGNSCTDASQFTHYSIQAIGPAASFLFYGGLTAS